MSVLRGHRPFRAWTKTADFGAPCGKRGVVRIRQVPVPPGMGPIYEGRISDRSTFSFDLRDQQRPIQTHVPGGLNPLFLQDAAWESFSQRFPSLVPGKIDLPDGQILDPNHMLLYVPDDGVTTHGHYVLVHAASNHVIECRQSFYAPTEDLYDLFAPEPHVVYVDPGWQYVVLATPDGSFWTCWPCESPQREMTAWTLPPVPNAEIFDCYFQGNCIYFLCKKDGEEEEEYAVSCTEILGSMVCSPNRHIMTLTQADLPAGLAVYTMVVSPRESAFFFLCSYLHYNTKVFFPSGPRILREEWLFPEYVWGKKILIFDSAEHMFFPSSFHHYSGLFSYYCA